MFTVGIDSSKNVENIYLTVKIEINIEFEKNVIHITMLLYQKERKKDEKCTVKLFKHCFWNYTLLFNTLRNREFSTFAKWTFLILVYISNDFVH